MRLAAPPEFLCGEEDDVDVGGKIRYWRKKMKNNAVRQRPRREKKSQSTLALGSVLSSTYLNWPRRLADPNLSITEDRNLMQRNNKVTA